jgi:hypothetical protein
MDFKEQENRAMTKEIQVFVPGLPNTPGWVALSQHDREWLQEHTSSAVDNFRQSGFKAIQACAELAMIENFLDDKPMTMTNWMRTCLGASERTGWRWLANYKEMRGSASDEAILYLAREGVAGLNNVQAGDIAPVIKRLPPPKSGDKKSLEAWRDKIAEELRENRRNRRKGRKTRLDSEMALKAFVVDTRRLLRDANLNTTAEQKAWLKRGVGYVMETRAIGGTLTAERTAPPDGWLPRRGRPRITEGKRKDKVA